jgi:hypothetical protein
VLLLVHVPPVSAFVSVIVEPAQTDDGPPIVAGSGLTVTVIVLAQPEPIV